MPQFRAVYGSAWNVYIWTPIGLVECFYIAFPRLGMESRLDPVQKAEIDAAYVIATEIAARFETDGRFTATELEIKKAFNRNYVK